MTQELSKNKYDILLSLVWILRGESDSIKDTLKEIISTVKELVDDFEIVVVDNASNDGTSSYLKELIKNEDFPNIQVFVLSHEVDKDVATWAGLEGALGDYVLIFDPSRDTLEPLDNMLIEAIKGADVVYAENTKKENPSFFYKISTCLFDQLYRLVYGIKLTTSAPSLKLVNRIVLNNILRDPNPELAYRHLPLTKGFKRANLEYRASSTLRPEKESFMQYFDRGIRLLITTKQGPLRLISLMSLVGASFNLIYTVYVVLVAIFKEKVAEGWVTLSLQQASMFFMVFLVFMVFGEYLAHIISLSEKNEKYSVTDEFFSSVVTRRSKLNVLNQSNE
jgi:glycosyltransferase involved in cell wall biosynthesis